MNLRVGDVTHGGRVVARATVVRRTIGQPVGFELTEQTGDAAGSWMAAVGIWQDPFLLPSRLSKSPPYPLGSIRGSSKGGRP